MDHQLGKYQFLFKLRFEFHKFGVDLVKAFFLSLLKNLITQPFFSCNFGSSDLYCQFLPSFLLVHLYIHPAQRFIQSSVYLCFGRCWLLLPLHQKIQPSLNLNKRFSLPYCRNLFRFLAQVRSLTFLCTINQVLWLRYPLHTTTCLVCKLLFS